MFHSTSVSLDSVSTFRERCIASLRLNPELSDASDAKLEYGWILAHVKDSHVQDQSDRIAELCRRRGSGQPLQYVLGTVDFGELTMLTRPPIFIPRAETAYIMDHLADILLEHPVMSTLERPLRILDLCTGSGSLALMLAHRLRSKAHLTAVDINPEAVTLARENAALNGLTSHVDFVVQDFTTSDLGEASFDLVVSNPPYIPHGEWETLSPSVKDHEDPRALIGDPQDFPAQSREHPISESSDGQGLYFYRKIAQKLPLFCKSSILRQSRGLPLLAVECGATQADDVQHIFKTQTSGLISSTTVVKDQFGQDRMVIGLT